MISTKAGWGMWAGPYGDWGSRKYLLASLDQSLKRMGLEYVDIFYSHRPDPKTPLEETMAALAIRRCAPARRSTPASPTTTRSRPPRAARSCALGTPCLIHQPKYSMFARWIEGGLLERRATEGIGGIAFRPLAQGLLTEGTSRHPRRFARQPACGLSQSPRDERGSLCPDRALSMWPASAANPWRRWRSPGCCGHPHHQRPDRRQQRGAGGAERRCAGEPGLHWRGVGPDRRNRRVRLASGLWAFKWGNREWGSAPILRRCLRLRRIGLY